MKILRVLQYSVCVLLRQWSEVQNKALFRCVCFITAGPVITRYHSNRGVSAVSRCAADLEIAERL
jgi:hypothetical protein